MKNNKKIIQEKQKMSTQFAWITTALIAVVSLLIVISVMSFFAQIIRVEEKQAQRQDFYVSSKIYEYVVNNFDTNRQEMEIALDQAVKSEVIAFVTVKDKKGRTLYSVDAQRKYGITDRDYKYYAPQYVSPKYNIAIGFFQENVVKNYIVKFLNRISVLTAFCIFFGLLMSYFMFKIVNKPFEELISAAKTFEKGNFNAHLQKSNYEEINTLVDTYNAMADSLNELYSSLEMKVEMRTVELERAYKELKDAQTMMVHSEKMRSLGGLVAGITHEINNPVNFIYGNLVHLKNYSETLIKFISKLEEILNRDNAIKEEVENLNQEYDFEFIKEDLPNLIKSCQEGAERTKNIIMDLKNFSRMGEHITSSIDLATEIDTTLNILHNKIKNRIEVIKDYAPDMPKVDAFGGQLNQVFMNILDNATYAIKDTGVIKIIMRYDEKCATITIEDNGCGMKQDVVNKIFEPFYTTKPTGEGTGLGMSISYKIIQNHNGKISVESEEGKGTKFIITLPIVNKDVIKGV